VNRSAFRVFAVVAGRSYHNDDRVDQFANSVTDRIVFVRINSRRAETHIYDLHTVVTLVSDQPVECGEHSGNFADSGGIQNAQIDQIRSRSDAFVRTASRGAITSSDCGDVRSVSPWIVGAFLAG